MKQQATKMTPQEQAYYDYWISKGYKFKPGEKPPMSTQTPPGIATKHPVADAFAGLFIVLFVAFLAGLWVYYGAGLHHG